MKALYFEAEIGGTEFSMNFNTKYMVLKNNTGKIVIKMSLLCKLYSILSCAVKFIKDPCAKILKTNYDKEIHVIHFNVRDM